MHADPDNQLALIRKRMRTTTTHIYVLTIASELTQQLVVEWVTLPDKWPKWQPQTNIHMLAAAAIAEEFISQATIKEDIGLHHIDYSSLNRLLAVTAYVHRYINNLRRSQSRQSGPLTVKELNSAKTRWVQNCLEQSYLREIASIKSKPGQSGMKKPPLVRHLRLFVDDTGLLRCGGQIHNAPLSEAAKFPYLLPQDNHLTLLIVNHVHVSLSHAGVGSTLTALRQSFWIPSGCQYVCAAVQFVGNMGADHTLLQSQHYFQRSGYRMCHHSPSPV